MLKKTFIALVAALALIASFDTGANAQADRARTVKWAAPTPFPVAKTSNGECLGFVAGGETMCSPLSYTFAAQCLI